jgi:hypothetical protein
LLTQALSRLRDTCFPPPTLHHLLRAERDQHADDDNPHLAGERAPAVERFGEVDVQPISLSRSVCRIAVLSEQEPGLLQ